MIRQDTFHGALLDKIDLPFLAFLSTSDVIAICRAADSCLFFCLCQ